MEAETQSGPLDDASAAEAAFARRGCCCFWIPWSGPERWERIQGGERSAEERSSTPHPGKEGWWRRGIKALMKVREWSEVVAGPKWKTFIRRFNRNYGGGGGGGGGGGARFGSTRFQYDPLSYALNFDEGHGASPEGDFTGYRDFSTRFVGPVSTKSSMDLGGRDAPPLFSSAGGGGGAVR